MDPDLTRTHPGSTFDEGVTRFRAFLRSEGRRTSIHWVDSSKVSSGRPVTIESLDPSHEVQPAKNYRVALAQGLGVCFQAVCTIAGTTYHSRMASERN
jgi:hypothetical protein